MSGTSRLRAKRVFKRAWSTQPFNAAVTHTIRSSLRLRGRSLGQSSRYVHHSGRTKERLPNGRTLTLWSDGNDEVANTVFWRGWAGYEPEVSGRFYRLAARAGTTLDIGANVGFYSALAGHANGSGTVLAFEPHPRVFPHLERTIELNGLENVRAKNLALGSESGSAELVEPASSALPHMSSLSREFAEAAGTDRDVRSFEVRLEMLDQVLAAEGRPAVDLIKLDTETTEAAVLRGAEDTIRRDRPHIFCEVLPEADVAALEEQLAPLGYRFVLLMPTAAEVRAHIQPDPRSENYLFTTDPDVVRELAPGDDV